MSSVRGNTGTKRRFDRIFGFEKESVAEWTVCELYVGFAGVDGDGGRCCQGG